MKRLFDVSAALVLLVLTAPLAVGVAALIRFRLGSPVLFTQQRIGHRGLPFMLVKFRTMSDACDESGQLLPDDQRLDRFGSFLRSTSLDELPTLLNVARGEMSLVGPRPLLPEYLPLYTEEQARRHDVLPGVTGWAQIHGRNLLTWERKFELDVWYVDNRSGWLDLRIAIQTVSSVLRRSGITDGASVTAVPFRGTATKDRPDESQEP